MSKPETPETMPGKRSEIMLNKMFRGKADWIKPKNQPSWVLQNETIY
jgi:hypothetical protein